MISTDIVTSNPCLFSFFPSFFSFISFSFLFLSCLLCPILLIYRNAARQELLYFFCNLNMSLKSEVCLNALCVSANIACWPLDRRWILHRYRRNLHRLHALQPLAFRHLSTESGFISWSIGSQLHAFSQGRAFLCFVVYAHSIGDRRTETCGRKKKKKKKTPMGTASASRKRLAFLALPWSVMGESTDSWAREGKWKSFEGSAHRTERCFHSRGSLLLRRRLDKRQLTGIPELIWQWKAMIG